jgi:hypothetical protein
MAIEVIGITCFYAAISHIEVSGITCFMLQFLFHLLSAIPRDKLSASLCCETSY